MVCDNSPLRARFPRRCDLFVWCPDSEGRPKTKRQRRRRAELFARNGGAGVESLQGAMVSMGEQIQVEEICSTPEMRVWNRRTGLCSWLGAEGGVILWTWNIREISHQVKMASAEEMEGKRAGIRRLVCDQVCCTRRSSAQEIFDAQKNPAPSLRGHLPSQTALAAGSAPPSFGS